MSVIVYLTSFQLASLAWASLNIANSSNLRSYSGVSIDVVSVESLGAGAGCNYLPACSQSGMGSGEGSCLAS